eukprot:TRINITY_DN5785_c0_g1_i1.p1 TRINITY_DN5785_c0_g1~~TRINITY_DN5785_c0_g1_i1.p1  ORF type:complete len:799 (-),score=299.01 TRINITY_DN5785_c0_g1_i1:160-2556(-)
MGEYLGRMSGNSGAIGIDFGGNNIVIGIVKRGGVEILANEGSHRETHNIVGFTQNERAIGEQASLKFKSNFKNTITYANRFLGLRANCPFLTEETKYLFSTITSDSPDGRLQFEVLYNGEKRRFYPEQIVAMVLQKAKQIISFNGVTSFDAVISVPSFYTEQERKALLDACKIAELKCLRLMNEHSATALNYGIFRKKEFDDKPRYVAFVDMGHAKTSAYVVSFTKDTMKVITQAHERNLGGRDMDWILYEFYCKHFENANGVSLRKSDKARMRLLEAVEKQRKVLSANSEASVHLEYIYEDYDLDHTIARPEFEQMIRPVLERLQVLINRVVNEVGKLDLKLHSVEIVGGVTRIPIVQKIIEDAFRVGPVSKTLNASECIARGCAIEAAIQSPLYKVVDYNVEDINYYPIRCNWRSLQGPGKMEIEEKPSTSILFDRECTIPKLRSINLKTYDNVEVVLNYDPVPDGADQLLGRYVVQNKKNGESDPSLKIVIELNANGITRVESARLTEEYQEEVKELVTPPPAQPGENKEGEAPAPAAPQYETKLKKKARGTDLQIEGTLLHQFTDQDIRQFYEDEVQMANSDRILHETHEKKNALEAFIYDTRNKLNGGALAPFATPAEAQNIITALGQNETWLYGEGANATKSVYVSKLDSLKAMAEPVLRRYRESDTIPDRFTEFLSVIAQHEAFANSKDAAYAHITQEERNRVLADVQTARHWIAESQGVIAAANKTQDLPISSALIVQRQNEFIKANQPIVNKPKPAPPKEEKPKEEAPKNEGGEPEKQEEQDGKMDIEQ